MVHYDPFMDEILNDPFPIYKRLRDERPAYFLEEHDCWALSRFEDVWNVSQDPQSFTSGEGPATRLLFADLPDEISGDGAERPAFASIHGMNPPEHTQLRKALTRHFTKHGIAKLESFIRDNVRENLAAVLPRGRCDVLTDLSLKLSVQVACKLIGLPLEDGDLIAGIVRRYFQREPGTRGMPADALNAMMELGGYLVNAVMERRRSGETRGDVMDAFMAFEIDGTPLADMDVASHLITLVVGGTETLPKIVAGGILQLYRHPEQRARLASDPSLMPDYNVREDGIVPARSEFVDGYIEMPIEFTPR